MDFASAFVLEEEEESDHEEERVFQMESAIESCEAEEEYTGGFECEIMDFDDEDFPRPPKQKSQGSSLNTVNLKLQVLKDEKPELILKEKFRYTCANKSVCGAVLSQIDKPIDIPDSSDKMWQCRFCGVQRTIKEWPVFEDCENGDILFVNDPDSLPDLDLDPGVNTVVFVLDCSGSMAHPIEGQSMMSMMGGGGQMAMMGLFGGHMGQMPNRKTRLAALTAGVVEEIKKLKISDPKTKVGVLYFHNEITILGDGSEAPVTITGSALNDYTLLLTTGQRQPSLGAVGQSCDTLVDKLQGLKEGGQTALGPALVIAMAMAAKSKTSKVILCTDGYANIGLGNIQGGLSRETEKFYQDVAVHCKTQGVSVSLISFDECGYAKAMGELPVETGGLLWRVNPENQDLKIQDVLTRKTMATDAFVRFVVNKQLYVDNAEDKEEERSNFTHLLGNIHHDMSHAFKFGFRRDEDSKKQRKDIKDQNGLFSEKPREDALKITEIIDQPKDNPNEKKETPDEKKNNPDEKMDNPDEKKENPDEKDTPKRDKEQKLVPYENVQSTPDKTQDEKDAQNAVEKIDANNALAIAEDPNKEFIPFQVQIYFVDLNGTEATRIWTSLKPITGNKQKAEEASNTSTLIANTIQTASKRLLEIFNGKLVDASLNSESRKLRDDFNKMLEQKNITDDESAILNGFIAVLSKISQTSNIDDEVAEKLRNFQAKGVIMGANQTTPVVAM